MTEKKNARKWIARAGIMFAALLIAALVVFTDRRETPEENQTGIDVYYLDPVSNTLAPERRLVPAMDNSGLATETIRLLYEGPKSQTLSRTFPEAVRFVDGRIVVNESADDTLLELEFSPEYLDMPPAQEQFFRASLVWSMTGLGFVDDLIIYIGDSELLRPDGEPLGRLNRENTLVNPTINAA